MAKKKRGAPVKAKSQLKSNNRITMTFIDERIKWIKNSAKKEVPPMSPAEYCEKCVILQMSQNAEMIKK